jgi:hypothetical protein
LRIKFDLNWIELLMGSFESSAWGFKNFMKKINTFELGKDKRKPLLENLKLFLSTRALRYILSLTTAWDTCEQHEHECLLIKMTNGSNIYTMFKSMYKRSIYTAHALNGTFERWEKNDYWKSSFLLCVILGIVISFFAVFHWRSFVEN